jgi:hypothetical protein
MRKLTGTILGVATHAGAATTIAIAAALCAVTAAPALAQGDGAVIEHRLHPPTDGPANRPIRLTTFQSTQVIFPGEIDSVVPRRDTSPKVIAGITGKRTVLKLQGQGIGQGGAVIAWWGKQAVPDTLLVEVLTDPLLQGDWRVRLVP